MTNRPSRPACVLTTLALAVLLSFWDRPSASGQGPEKSSEAKAREENERLQAEMAALQAQIVSARAPRSRKRRS